MHRFFFVAFALITASSALEAKGETVKLAITGPGLTVPVEIVERGIIDQSNVWEGSFIGERIEDAPQVSLPLYTVTFDVQLPEWQREGVRGMYTVSVARDARGGGLLLYLPGRGEPGYGLNVSTMLRDTQDGHWHRPPAAWASLVAIYLP